MTISPRLQAAGRKPYNFGLSRPPLGCAAKAKDRAMSHVVTESCIKCKYVDAVGVLALDAAFGDDVGHRAILCFGGAPEGGPRKSKIIRLSSRRLKARADGHWSFAYIRIEVAIESGSAGRGRELQASRAGLCMCFWRVP